MEMSITPPPFLLWLEIDRHTDNPYADQRVWSEDLFYRRPPERCREVRSILEGRQDGPRN